MTSGVKDQVEFRVLVNGEPLPASTNVWNSIKIVERAIDYGLPFAELSLRDSRAATHETNQVAEGTLITITAKRIDGDREREMNFRVIGPISSNRQGAGDHTNVWMCVLDHPRYYSQVHHFAARATSAQLTWMRPSSTARALAARIRNCPARGPAPLLTYFLMKSGDFASPGRVARTRRMA